MIAATILQVLFLVTVHAISNQGSSVTKYKSGDNADYDAAVHFLTETDAVTLYFYNRLKIADWNYFSNLTEENKKVYVSMLLIWKRKFCFIFYPTAMNLKKNREK